MGKKSRALLIALLVLILSACSNSKEDAMHNEMSAVYEQDSLYRDEGSGAYLGVIGDADENYTSYDPESGSGEQERKLIKNANLYMSVKDYDGSVAKIRVLAEEHGGYVEHYSFDLNGSGNIHKSGSLIIRVPQESYETALAEIQAFGTVHSLSEDQVDETERYYDISRRMDVKLAEEKRLLEILGKAETVTEIIAVEDKLSSVRAEIEIYQGQLNNIDQLSSYATINISLTENKSPEIQPISANLWKKMENGFKSSINGLVKFAENLLVFIAGTIIPLLILSVLCITGFLIVRAGGKKRQLKYTEPEKTENVSDKSDEDTAK